MYDNNLIVYVKAMTRLCFSQINKTYNNMKILFIQLPLIDHSHGYINGNIDYAPAVISSFIQKNFKDITCIRLPYVLCNFCSDEIIIKYISAESPDIICFTSYLWNVERNLRLSKLIKTKMNNTQIFFGGPEISAGSIALSSYNSDVDIFISGEGEWFFELFLSGKNINITKINSNNVAIQQNNELIGIKKIVEPFSNNNLDTLIDGSAFIEMTRGCPYKCSYCFYSKNQNRVRELPFSILLNVIKNKKEVKDIYILSPAFETSKNFIQNLESLKKMNHNVTLHTEIRAENISKDIANLMYEAGFRSLEVGLQSMNKNALSSVKRKTNPDKELTGIENLSNAGINLKIGIIPGLPDDDINSFLKTVDVLCNRGFEEFIELYPLMILPGTEIREQGLKDNIEFQKKPPYYFTEGWNFNFEDIKSISAYIENKTGLSNRVFYLPDFSDSDDSLFTKGLILDDNCKSDISKSISDSVDTYVTDIHITVISLNTFYNLVKNFIKTADRNRLYNIVIYSNLIFDESLISGIMKEFETDNFYRRLNIFNSFAEGSIFHFFQVINNLHTYFEVEERYSIITPVLYADHNTAKELAEKNFNDMPLLIESEMYNRLKNFLISNYNKNPEYIAFKNSNDMENFYNDISADLIKFPFSFGLKKI
ncbi:MAG: radical SAM protein [Spirochaetes bacterium]|nr:radical SAM protein [Spirochaetota bacterium]